jgi:hypothetical protein
MRIPPYTGEQGVILLFEKTGDGETAATGPPPDDPVPGTRHTGGSNSLGRRVHGRLTTIGRMGSGPGISSPT